MMSRTVLKTLVLVAAFTFAIGVRVEGQFQPKGSLGALAPANIAKPRPKPPFDLTGTWQHSGGAGNGFQFAPPAGFKLTPAAQKHYDAAQAAKAERKVYRDDIGQGWPAGLPVIMTRVWPIAVIQLPTAVYMISEFMNSFRVIYTDGRPHTDPDIVVRTFNGESIGKWEGDALVVDTKNFRDDHHWIDNGIPASDELHIVERIKLIDQGRTMEIEYSLTDPKSWEGTWKMTKKFGRRDELDIQEVEHLPELNQHITSTQSKDNIR